MNVNLVVEFIWVLKNVPSQRGRLQTLGVHYCGGRRREDPWNCCCLVVCGPYVPGEDLKQMVKIWRKICGLPFHFSCVLLSLVVYLCGQFVCVISSKKKLAKFCRKSEMKGWHVALRHFTKKLAPLISFLENELREC